MNYIDFIIIALVGLSAYLGYKRGLIHEVTSALVLFVSLSGAYYGHSIFSNTLQSFMDIPESYAVAGSFFATWFLLETLLFLIAKYFLQHLDEKIIESRWILWGGAVVSDLKTTVFILIAMSFLVIPPLSVFVGDEVKGSFAGRLVSDKSDKFEGFFRNFLSGVASDFSKFTSITSGSGEKVDLGFTVVNPDVDRASANEMLRYVNKERKKEGLSELKSDPVLSKVAENYGMEMFKEGYLSHISKTGKTPFERMKDADISFFYAGENLAVAPTVEDAMNGLMESPGHKANILSGNYGKIGISVLDGGARGKIFVQEFTD